MSRAPRSSRSPRGEVLYRLRQLEKLCLSQHHATEQSHFQALAELLALLATGFEHSREPLEWLVAVATVSRRNAEALMLRRVRAWRAP